MNGARSVVHLGRGIDVTTGAPYIDTFFFLDFGLFLGPSPSGCTGLNIRRTSSAVLPYERATEAMVDAQNWARYQSTIKQTVGRGWVRSVIPVSDIYGMFIVGPKTTSTTHATYITRVAFGENTGVVSRMASDLQYAFKNGFSASVAIAAQEQDGAG
jgi:hypothetical protein